MSRPACLDCGTVVVMYPRRGLCTRCYRRRHRAGTLGDRPVRSRPDRVREPGLTRGSEVEQLLLLTGVTYRQLDYWAREGYLHPETPASGPGYQRAWPSTERAVAIRLARLVRAGVRPATAATLARHAPFVADQVAELIETADLPVGAREAG